MMPIPSSSSSSTTSSSFELQLPGQKAGCKTWIYSSYELLSTGFLAISAAWSKFGGLVVFFGSAVGHGPTYISQIPSPNIAQPGATRFVARCVFVLLRTKIKN